MKAVDMTEPASTAAAGMAAWKFGLLAKLGVLIGAGALGAMLIAAVDPAEAEPDPKKRRKLIFAQVVSAMVFSSFFTKPVVRWLDYALDWIDLSAGGAEAWLEIALPVGLLIGALSWGALGALVKLRKIIAERAAKAVADRVMPQQPQQPEQ
jgi:hypothetical protein